MARSEPSKTSPSRNGADPDLPRLARPLSLSAQVEQLLRQAIAEGRFPSGRLPTETELARQLGVGRETVRVAAEVLQREGLVVKARRRGTFTHAPWAGLQIQARPSTLIGYMQADYQVGPGREEAVTRAISGLMLQGANEEAGRAGYQLVVRHAPHLELHAAFQQLYQSVAIGAVVFATYCEEKIVRRMLGLGLPTLLLDHDMQLPHINSVRDDSFQGARQAVAHLTALGHRRIAYAPWRQTDWNPWRLGGYRQGLQDAALRRRKAWEIPVELTERGAVETVDRVLTQSPRVTAVYCFNNTLARLVIAELVRRGVRVPQDISVMGGGGEEVPGLTCHQPDWHHQGRVAVQVLLRSLADPEAHAPEHHLSAHTLHVGRTTAAPAA